MVCLSLRQGRLCPTGFYHCAENRILTLTPPSSSEHPFKINELGGRHYVRVGGEVQAHPQEYEPILSPVTLRTWLPHTLEFIGHLSLPFESRGFPLLFALPTTRAGFVSAHDDIASL